MESVTNLLSALFPPSTRSLGRLLVIDETEYDEQGSCGQAKRKRFANGIERTFAEMDGEK